MFTVNGYTRDAMAYRVVIEQGRDGQLGVVRSAPASVIELLAGHEGRTVGLTPTGPFYTLSMDNAETVLAALYALTEVKQVTGDDVPNVTIPHDRDDPDLVY